MFDSLDPLAVALLGFAVIGIIDFVKVLFDKDYKSASIIAAAAIAGAIFASQAGAITWFQGMLIGFQASGFVSTARRIGGN